MKFSGLWLVVHLQFEFTVKRAFMIKPAASRPHFAIDQDFIPKRTGLTSTPPALHSAHKAFHMEILLVFLNVQLQ